MTTNPVEWCGASTRGYGPMPIGPCVLRHGHDGPLHRDESGVSWTDPRPASESSEPMCPPALRDRLAKALRGKYDSSDSRPSYRAADAVLPVVQAALAEQTQRADNLEAALAARVEDHAMAAEFVGEWLGISSPLPAVTSIGCVQALAAYADDDIAELRKRAEKAEARLAELEGALNWQTSCTSCARVLDASYADHVRAEQAEALLREFVSDTPCDPHPGNGFCQTHGERKPCPQAQAKALLATPDRPEGT